MAGRIPQNFIDDLVARADVVEIVNARVPLKRKGKEYTACCPFHNEKTPSFTVSETKQFYHCFGCGAHGTALGFLMEYENMEFIDAVEELAAIYHLEIPREQGVQTKQNDRQPLYDMLTQVDSLYQQQLKQSERAIAYLKQRGLSGDIAKHYHIGFAPDGWDFLAAKFNDDAHTSALVQTGMLVKKDNGGYYDRFRDRIMFAITNRRGKVIGFGGRVLDKGEPKYLNSPENALFHKGLEVYGLYEANRATRDLTRIIVVEGYMDVVALAQFGISYAVASLGTATTKEQIQTIFRSTQQIVFCYDGDKAGRKAAWRALENTLEVIRDGQHAKFLFLPDGEDPDSLVRQEGKDTFETRMDESTSLSEFMFKHLTEQCEMDTVEGRSKLIELAKPLFASMPDSLFKDLLLEELSSISAVSTEKFTTYANTKNKPLKTETQETKHSQKQKSPVGLRTAIALLIQFPELVNEVEIPESFRNSSIRGLTLLYNLHTTISSNPEINSIALLERFRDDSSFEALTQLHQHEVPDLNDVETRKKLYVDHVKHITVSVDIDADAKDARLKELQEKMEANGIASLTIDEKQELNKLITS
jgi:DNA primase